MDAMGWGDRGEGGPADRPADGHRRCAASRWEPSGGQAVAVVAAWIAIVVVLTWPLSAHMRTRLPYTQSACAFDALLAAWAGAWESEALLHAPSRLVDAGIYHPAKGALLYVESGLGALPVFAPAYLATGNPALALNVTFLLGAALTAAALHLVAGSWTGSFLAGVVAGWSFLTTKWALWVFGPTAPNYVVLFWFPAIMLLAARLPRSRRGYFLLGTAIVLQSLVSAVYVAAAVFAPLVVLAIIRLARSSTRASGARLSIILAVALLVLAPLYAGLLGVRRDNPALDRQTIWTISQPTHLPWGPFKEDLSPMAAPWLVYVLVGIGLLTHLLRRRPGELRAAWRHGGLWFFVGFVGSLAREIDWNGSRFPGPLGWVGQLLPQVMVLRVPSRIGIASGMGLSLLAAAAFSEVEGLLRRRLGRGFRSSAIVGGFAAAMVAGMFAICEHGLLSTVGWRGEYPTIPAIDGTSRIIGALAASGRPVIELGSSDGPLSGTFAESVEFEARAMYRSAFHHAPILNGYGSFWPAGWLERMTLARRAPAPGVIGRLAEETGLAHVLVHARGLSADDRARWLASPELRLSATEGDDLLFDVVAPAAPADSPGLPSPVASPASP